MPEIQVVILSLVIGTLLAIVIIAFIFLFALIGKTVFDVFTKKLT